MHVLSYLINISAIFENVLHKCLYVRANLAYINKWKNNLDSNLNRNINIMYKQYTIFLKTFLCDYDLKKT